MSESLLRDLDRTPPRNLPAASAEEAAHSERVSEVIRARIAESRGAFPFSEFMQLALYAPGLGYYSAGRQKFGEAGDFITAPELSPLFSRCLARACAPILRELAHTGSADVLEAGAGTGAMAAEILLTLADADALPRRYFILELSADLRARQYATLAARAPTLLARVEWLDELPAHGFRGVVLGNELLDAMPVERFIQTADGARVLHVGADADGFHWRFGDAARDSETLINARVAALALPPGYISEINLQAEAWLRSVGERLAAGAAILIDYGFPRAEFYHPQRAHGTLMCHYRHRAHANPFVRIGAQDITAHIDFTALAEAADAAGLAVRGFTSQAAFLLALGLMDAAQGADVNDVRGHLATTAQIKRLTLPSEMGELFKVIAFTRDYEPPVQGFTLQDRRARL